MLYNIITSFKSLGYFISISSFLPILLLHAGQNIINDDGPDVDQGLCILLPVTIMDEHNVTHDPADGSMLEFLFNIWPNHKYDGRAVNDLIINKSQIYVYSVPD